jgi:hypothetical protein
MGRNRDRTFSSGTKPPGDRLDILGLGTLVEKKIRGSTRIAWDTHPEDDESDRLNEASKNTEIQRC